MKTTLGHLREFRTWTDEGQTGEDESLVDDDTEVEVRSDGSVAVVGGGVLVGTEDVDGYWVRWLVGEKLIPARRWVLGSGPDSPIAYDAEEAGWRWISTGGDPIFDGEYEFDEFWKEIVEKGLEFEAE